MAMQIYYDFWSAWIGSNRIIQITNSVLLSTNFFLSILLVSSMSGLKTKTTVAKQTFLVFWIFWAIYYWCRMYFNVYQDYMVIQSIVITIQGKQRIFWWRSVACSSLFKTAVMMLAQLMSNFLV